MSVCGGWDDGDHDFALRMSSFAITEGFNRIAQWVTSVDDGYHFSGYKQIGENIQILRIHFGDEEAHFLAADSGEDWGEHHVRKDETQSASDHDKGSMRGEAAAVSEDRMMGICAENQVVFLTISREIFLL